MAAFAQVPPVPSEDDFYENIPDTITLGSHSSVEGMVVNEQSGFVYVTDSSYDGPFLYVIDSSNNIVETIVLNLDHEGGIAVNAKTNTIYASLTDREGVAIIDGSKNDVVGSFAEQFRLSKLVVNPQTNLIYGIDGHTKDKVHVINGNDKSLLQTIPLGSDLDIIVVNPVTNLIYVTDGKGGKIFVIDGSKAVLSDTLLLEGDLTSMAINPAKEELYVIDSLSNKLYVLDASNHSLLESMSFDSNLQSVAVNPNTNKIYLLNTTTQSYRTYSPTLNGIVGRNYGTIAVIDGNTKAIEDKIGSGYFWSGILAVNPTINKVYVGKAVEGGVNVSDGSTNTVEYSSLGIFVTIRVVSTLAVILVGTAMSFTGPLILKKLLSYRYTKSSQAESELLKKQKFYHAIVGAYLTGIGIAFIVTNLGAYGPTILFLLLIVPWLGIPLFSICGFSIWTGSRILRGKKASRASITAAILWTIVSSLWIFSSDVIPNIFTTLITINISENVVRLETLTFLINISILSSSFAMIVLLRVAKAFSQFSSQIAKEQ